MTQAEPQILSRQLKAIAGNVDGRAMEFEGHPATLLRAIAGDLRREAAEIASKQSGEPAS